MNSPPPAPFPNFRYDGTWHFYAFHLGRDWEVVGSQFVVDVRVRHPSRQLVPAVLGAVDALGVHKAGNGRAGEDGEGQRRLLRRLILERLDQFWRLWKRQEAQHLRQLRASPPQELLPQSARSQPELHFLVLQQQMFTWMVCQVRRWWGSLMSLNGLERFERAAAATTAATAATTTTAEVRGSCRVNPGRWEDLGFPRNGACARDLLLRDELSAVTAPGPAVRAVAATTAEATAAGDPEEVSVYVTFRRMAREE